MADQQEFCLRWNDFHSNFHLSLEALRGDESFTDVTLSCSGRLIRAHRVILSACSVHFKEILRGIPPQQHPVIVLPTVDFEVMQAIMDFIYQGQVNVKQSQLGAFLQVAETFSIQGLADDETKKNAKPDTEQPTAKRRRAEPPPPPASPPAAKSTPPAGSSQPEAAPPLPLHHPSLAAAHATDTEKTVNISVSIKAESMADSMVGELLEHSADGEMLDPDLEGGSDVVAQAMATIEHESVDTTASATVQMRRHGVGRSVMGEPAWQMFGACCQLMRAAIQGRCVRCLKNTRRMCVGCGARLHANCFSDHHIQLWQMAGVRPLPHLTI